MQQSDPQKIYRYPVNEYTAALFGTYNVFTPALAKAFNSFARNYNPQLHHFVRPEQIIITGMLQGVKAVVKKIDFMGSFNQIESAVAGSSMLAYTTKWYAPGDVIFVSIDFENGD